jgi:hypothetical protein
MTRYRNPWHNPRKPHYGPEFYETDAKPVEHAGCLIYHRINSTQPIASGAHVFDVVKGGVCVHQMAGPNGARRAAESIQQEARRHD